MLQKYCWYINHTIIKNAKNNICLCISRGTVNAECMYTDKGASL